jgi:hypothetical protein
MLPWSTLRPSVISSMTKRIVYTRNSDGGVSVCTPTQWAIETMSCGGFWSDMPRGFGNTQIERQIARGVNPDAARRYVRAVQFGGLTTAEAYAVIRDRDCAHLGHTFELLAYSDLPDRWFRDAWRPNHNGGPPRIDLELARPIQWRRLRGVAAQEDKRGTEAFEEERPLHIDWPQIRTAIKHASSVDALRNVWPQELNRMGAPT